MVDLFRHINALDTKLKEIAHINSIKKKNYNITTSPHQKRIVINNKSKL